MLPVLALLPALVGLLACMAPGADQAPATAALVPLTVTVAVTSPNGAARGPGAGPSVSLPQLPVAGIEVRAVAPGDATVAPEASAVTDADGNAVLDLPAGQHWVFVLRAQPAGAPPLGATVVQAMPDGTLTPAWAEVDLSDGSPAAITLSPTRLNP